MPISALEKETILVELSNAFTETIVAPLTKEKSQSVLRELYTNHCKRRAGAKETHEEMYAEWVVVLREFLKQVNSVTKSFNDFMKRYNGIKST